MTATIQVRVAIKRPSEKTAETIVLEKTAQSTEIEVLASAISTIFLKSKDAKALADKRGAHIIPLSRSKKRR